MAQTFPRLTFSRNWEDPADYPTHETSEIQNRKDIQSLFTEIQTYLNEILLPGLELGQGGGGGGTVSGDYLPLSGGTMRGVLRLFRNPPLLDDEAACKLYVDTVAASVVDNLTSLLDALREELEGLDSLDATAVRNIVYYTVAGRRDWQSLLQEFVDLTASAPYTDGTDIYVNLTLKLGSQSVTAPVKMSGSLDVSGTLSAGALYADYGEIADLCVDRLSTSRRIPKYLSGVTDDDNFIRVQGQVIEFVAGHCQGSRVQASNPAGYLLYWPEDVSGLDRGSDGYPRSALGLRVAPATTPTDFPVYVYQYTEEVKRAIRFDLDSNGIYTPRDIFGAGNASGQNQAYIDKGTELFHLHYVTPAGADIGVRMGAGGFVDIDGLRSCAALDFSGWSAGSFSETLEGSGTVRTYSVTFDGSNRPVRISDGVHTLAVTW